MPPFRESFDAGLLNVPLVGRLARGYNAARFAGTLSMLGRRRRADPEGAAGRRRDAVEPGDARRCDGCAGAGARGAPLRSALAGKKRFPGLLAMFSRLGEQTGQLPLMLERAARQLGTEVQRRAMQMATILEPLLIVVMGVVVMLIVLAVLLPIIQLNTWVK
jgi:general secretion pathway protein F